MKDWKQNTHWTKNQEEILIQNKFESETFH